MVPDGASKRCLDTSPGGAQASAVRPSVLLFSIGLFLGRPLGAQAPEWADLWRVTAATLATPAALERGATGSFWNPAAITEVQGLAGGLEVMQTPDVVSLSGVLGVLSGRVSRFASVGVHAGRMSVTDLVRTSTSPTSELGEIPVYSQLLGISLGARFEPVGFGATLRVHDAQFDTRSDAGVTLDFGLLLRPTGRITIAAASRFVPADFSREPTTDYYAAAEYQLRTASLWGAEALVIGRYGFAYRPDGGVEHGVSAGLALERRFQVDMGWTREIGYGLTEWRPVLAVSLQVGRYLIALARGNGLNGLGASYRIGLNAGILQ